MDQIKISVIMSVYNTKTEYLKEAIDSILNQTFNQFEFIIVNDGSDYKTQETLDEYVDKRIKIITNQTNLGLTQSLNIALEIAQGKYIARMDADDISMPDRLKKQYNYMEKNKEIGVLGCWTGNNVNNKVQHWCGNVSSEWRRVEMLFGNCGIAHPTAMIRKSILDQEQIKYNETIKKSQDYELWTKLLKYTKMAVYPEKLFIYRLHSGQITVYASKQQKFYSERIRRRLFDELQIQLSEKQMAQILDLKKTILNMNELEQVFQKLEKANENLKIYDDKILHYALVNIWVEIVITRIKKKEFNSLCRLSRNYIITPKYMWWRTKLYIDMHFN